MIRPYLLAPLIAFGCMSAALCTGCSGSRDGNTQAHATVTSAKDSREELVAAKGEISSAVADLDLIMSHGDLTTSYRNFNNAVEAVKNREKSVKKERERMEENQTAYVAQWQQESAKMTNDDLRRSSIDRQAAVKQQFSAVTEAYRELENLYRPLIITLGELKADLGNDLTPAAVDAIKPVADTIGKDAGEVQSQINVVIGKLYSLINSLSSGSEAASK